MRSMSTGSVTKATDIHHVIWAMLTLSPSPPHSMPVSPRRVEVASNIMNMKTMNATPVRMRLSPPVDIHDRSGLELIFR